jgi:hypothetical protein
MVRSGAVMVLCLAMACRPGATAKPSEVGPELPIVDRADPPFAGTWVGPELTLSFVGEWVLVRPSGEPGVKPIELRVFIERHESDAFALQTSLAGVLAADFLRAPDWVLLIEGGQLVLAMGDEPLQAYVIQADAEEMLRGPSMLGEIQLPVELRMADAIACLEVAGDRCADLEAEGPIAIGCRELQWGICVEQLGPVPIDPVERAAWTTAGKIRAHALELRYCAAVVEAANDGDRAAAQGLLERARVSANATVARLREDGPLPEGDPHLAELNLLMGK